MFELLLILLVLGFGFYTSCKRLIEKPEAKYLLLLGLLIFVVALFFGFLWIISQASFGSSGGGVRSEGFTTTTFRLMIGTGILAALLIYASAFLAIFNKFILAKSRRIRYLFLVTILILTLITVSWMLLSFPEML